MKRSSLEKQAPAWLLITSVLALCWAATLRTPFLLDDYFHLLALEKKSPQPGLRLLNTYSTERFSPQELKGFLPWWVDSSGYKFHYFRPLASYSLKMDYALSGKNPFGFHLTSLVLHIGCTLLLYALAISFGADRTAGVLSALVAGLHPNNIFSVTWVSSRDILLSLFLFLLSCLCFDRFLSRDSRRLRFWGASFGFYLLGLFSKETLFFAPAILFGLALFRLDTRRAPGSRRRFDKALLYVLPFLVSSLVYIVWYFVTGHGVKTGYVTVSSELPLISNLAIAAKAFLVYVLSLLFYLPPEFSMEGPTRAVIVWALCTVGAFSALLFWKRKIVEEHSVILLSLVWVLGFIVFPLCFLPMGRLLYFSVFGYALLIGMTLNLILGAVRTPYRKKILWGVLVMYFVIGPALAIIAAVPRINTQGRLATEDCDGKLYDFVKANPGTEHVFLMNVPTQFTAFTARMMFFLYHPEMPQRIHVLSNDSDLPLLEAKGEHTLVASNPKGIIRTGAPGFQTRHLRPGSRCDDVPLHAEIGMLDGRNVTAITFRFDSFLNDPAYAFVGFVGQDLKRIDIKALGNCNRLKDS